MPPWTPQAAAQPGKTQDQLTINSMKRTNMANDNEQPTNPPMPYTTKQRSKRKKHPFGPKQPGIRVPNPIGLIYRKTTNCVIADEATEARLKRLETTTSNRHGGMQFIW